MTTHWRSRLVAVLLLAGQLAGCSPKAPEPLRAVPLEVTEFTITPVEISAQVGDGLSFRIANLGVLEHDVSIRDPNGEEVALLSLLPNQNGTLQVEPSVAGEWRIICTLPGHEMAGMEASLAVSN
ncbi:MAG: hypothetical protein FJZ97_09680 [Chloroflexi bacterium]|nr:hypothetical protein [Chloroflexota bacterium]